MIIRAFLQLNVSSVENISGDVHLKIFLAKHSRRQNYQEEFNLLSFIEIKIPNVWNLCSTAN